MKKFKLLALALVIGASSLFANTTTTLPDDVTKNIRTQIVELLNQPEFNVSEDVKLMITFTFSSEGEIVVLAVNSRDSDILNYVRENVNGKKIQNPGVKNRQYTMPLTMKKG